MRHSFVSSAFTLSLLLALPRPASAAVVWTATHEAGDLKEWTGGANLTKTLPDNTVRKNVEVVGEQVYGGKLACKVTVHQDDTFGQYNQDRVDLNHHGNLSGEGKDSYLSGYFFLPEDSKTRTEILFYETETSFRNWMDLWVEPKQGGGTTVKFGIESQGATLGSVLLWTGDWTAAVWHQVAIHVHWSTNANQGLVDLWLDGKLVIDAVKHNTKFDNNPMFFNAGMHRLLPQPFTEVLYMDEFIEADALADIHVGAPMPGAGGSGGGGGTGGAGTGGTGGTTSGGIDPGGTSSGGTAGTAQAGDAGAVTAGTSAGGTTTTPTAGSGGGGGTTTVPTAGTGTTAGTSAVTPTGDAASTDSGCSCAVPGRNHQRKDSGGVLAALALLGFVKRRRRASA